jgi:hypothetical protein
MLHDLPKWLSKDLEVWDERTVKLDETKKLAMVQTNSGLGQ